MKLNRIAIIASALFLFANSSFAVQQGFCGTGKVTKLYAGGWDTNNIIFKMDYSVTSFTPGFKLFSDADQLMRVAPIGTNGNATNNQSRQDRIFSLLQASLLTGQNIVTFTHVGDCENITEVQLTTSAD